MLFGVCDRSDEELQPVTLQAQASRLATPDALVLRQMFFLIRAMMRLFCATRPVEQNSSSICFHSTVMLLAWSDEMQHEESDCIVTRIRGEEPLDLPEDA